MLTVSTRGCDSENSTVMLRAIIGTVFVFLRPPLTSPTADLAVLEGLDKVFFYWIKIFFYGLEIFLHGFCYLLFDFDAVQFRVTAQSMSAESDREVPN